LKEIQEKLAKLSQELQLAILRNEYETVKAIDAQIANLEVSALLFRDSISWSTSFKVL
jgi:protein-arginine kinase activator protein McsA